MDHGGVTFTELGKQNLRGVASAVLCFSAVPSALVARRFESSVRELFTSSSSGTDFPPLLRSSSSNLSVSGSKDNLLTLVCNTSNVADRTMQDIVDALQAALESEVAVIVELLSSLADLQQGLSSSFQQSSGMMSTQASGQALALLEGVVGHTGRPAVVVSEISRSRELWENRPEPMTQAILQHNRLLYELIAEFQGD
eukprot:RCo011872